jgi:hypothetical protein
LSRSEKNRVRRYRTEGEEIKLNDAYVEFVLCGKMPNLKIVYSILVAMDETQRGSKPMGEATMRRCCTFKKPKPNRLVCRKSLKLAKAESRTALWIG